jgi:hypothetical protein
MVAIGCESTPPARKPGAPPRMLMPSCPRGVFMAELDLLMPPLGPVALTPIHALTPDATPIDRTIEPGCVLPFHDRPGDESELDAGRVLVRTTARATPTSPIHAKPKLLGRGTLRIGRGRLELHAYDDAGDEVLDLRVDGVAVDLKMKGAPAFAGDVDVNAVDPLPLPLDALVAAISTCEPDERLGASGDGNIVQAKRAGAPLWRARWLDDQGAFVVDTSMLCSEGDVRYAWRSAAGQTMPMMELASARSGVTLLIERQPPSFTEDVTH